MNQTIQTIFNFSKVHKIASICAWAWCPLPAVSRQKGSLRIWVIISQLALAVLWEVPPLSCLSLNSPLPPEHATTPSRKAAFLPEAGSAQALKSWPTKPDKGTELSSLSSPDCLSKGEGEALIFFSKSWSMMSIPDCDFIHNTIYTLPVQKKKSILFCWIAFYFDYGTHLLWHCFDHLMQCHNIYFHPELQSFLPKIFYWWQESQTIPSVFSTTSQRLLMG